MADDSMRAADINNKHGYFEINDIINKIQKDPKIVLKYQNKVLKVTSYGLKSFPKGNYKIIYIERDIEEVLDSMDKMTGKRDENRATTKAVFLKLNRTAKNLMKERDDMDFITISYYDLIKKPRPVIDRIVKFLGLDSSKKEKMIEAIDVDSYRNRRVK